MIIVSVRRRHQRSHAADERTDARELAVQIGPHRVGNSEGTADT